MTTPTPTFGGYNVNPLGLEPAGIVAATMQRDRVSTTFTPTSGTPTARAIVLPGGVQVNNIGVFVNTSQATGTHAWCALLNRDFTVVASSADQTAPAYFTGPALVTTPMVSPGVPFVVPLPGIYYVVVCAVAGTMPSFCGDSAPATGVAVPVPVLCGTCAGGQTTPPAVGTQAFTVAAAATNNFYACIS